MKIKVLGPGCPKCEATAKAVREVIAETGVDAEIEKVKDIMEIAKLGVFMTPSVVIDGEIKCVGKVPKKDDITAWVKKGSGK